MNYLKKKKISNPTRLSKVKNAIGRRLGLLPSAFAALRLRWRRAAIRWIL